MHSASPLATLLLGVMLATACGGGDGATKPTEIGNGNPGGPGPTLPTAVSAPSGLAVIATTVASMQLSWQDHASDESGFELQRAPDSTEAFATVRIVAANVVSAIDDQLPANAGFRYRIRAVRGVETSSWSNTTAGRTAALPPVPSGPPATPTAEVVSTSRVVVRWTDTSTTVDSVVVERQRLGGADTAWARVAMRLRASPTQLQLYVDSTLTAGQHVRYRLIGYRSGTASAASGIADATTDEEVVGVAEQVVDVVTRLVPTAGTPLRNRNPLAELQRIDSALAFIPAIKMRLLFPTLLTLQVVTADGLSILIVNNKPAETTSGAMRVSSSRASSSRAAARRSSPFTSPTSMRVASRATIQQLMMSSSPGAPRAKQAVIAIHDGGIDGNAFGNEVGDMLFQAGYNVLPLGASLDDMRQYKNLGALYLDTHLGSYRRILSVNTDSLGTVTGFSPDFTRYHAALETSTDITKDDLARLKPELDAGELLLSITMGVGTLKARVAITDRFISKNWSFADGVAVIHACYFGSQPFIEHQSCNGACDVSNPNVFDPGPMRAAMRAKGAANIVSFDYYVGYDATQLFAAPSLRYFFDRMTGVNFLTPDSPPRRAHPHSTVQAAMQQAGLHRFQLGSSQTLGVTYGGKPVNLTYDSDATSILAPTIRFADVIDDASVATGTLTLNGIFGNGATVLYDGQSLPITSQSTEEIIAQLPYDEASRSGQIEVVSGGGIKSNKVPITEWRGTVTITLRYDGGTIGTIATMDLRFRGDVHKYRDGPASTGFVTRIIETTMSPSSVGSVRGYGTLSDGYSYTGNEAIQWYPRDIILRGGDSPRGVSTGGASLMLLSNQAELCMSVWGYVTVASGTLSERQLSLSVGLHGFDSMRGIMGCLALPMSSQFVVGGGSRVLFQEENVEIAMQWTPFTPTTPPTTSTPG